MSEGIEKEVYEGVLSLEDDEFFVQFDFRIGYVGFRYWLFKDSEPAGDTENRELEYIGKSLIGRKIRVSLLSPDADLDVDEDLIKKVWIEDLPDKKIVGRFNDVSVLQFRYGCCEIWRIEDYDCAAPSYLAGDNVFDWSNGYKRYSNWYVVIELLD